MEQRPVGVIGAMDVEVEAILQAAEIASKERYAGVDFSSGSLSGVPVVIARCSEGKVNSALCAQAMIDRYSPRLVLNIGVAGGLGPDVHIGDAVVGSSCVQYDFDSTALGSPLGEIGVPVNGERLHTVFFPCDKGLSETLRAAAYGLYSGTVHSGVIATGDRFVADPQFGGWLCRTFGALACEMEGASIAHVCLANQVPCVVLRSISDNANDSDTVDFRTFAAESAVKAQKLLAEVIGKL